MLDRERVPRVKLVSVRYRQNGEELVGLRMAAVAARNPGIAPRSLSRRVRA